MPATKVATCCYCGAKAALVLSGTQHHELTCSSCGAPLHNLKMLPTHHPGKRELVKPSKFREKDGAYKPERTRKKQKPRKSLKRRFFEEALDVLEDIFD